jgi:diguanylate cyclase (GGDEF)-like protein/PAS domain S-box-containing protein
MLDILVIEDTEADYHLIERQLRRQLGQVHCLQVSSNAELELALLQRDWDVVLTDYMLPGMHFEAVLARLRALRPGTPLILLSSHIGEERATELLHLGLTDYILKDRIWRLGPAIQRGLSEARLRQTQDLALQALRTSELRFRAIFDGISDAAIFTDPQRRILLVNQAFAEIFGCEPEQVRGQQPTFMYHSRADYDLLGELRYRADLRVEAGYFEWRYRRHDGSDFWAETHATPIYDTEGHMLGYFSLLRDIGERKKAETRQLQAATVFSNSQEGIVITTAGHTITSINPAFTSITGYTEREALGRPMSMMKSGRQDRGFYAEMRKALETEGVWRGEIWNRRKNGEIYPQWLAISAVRDSSGAVINYVGIFTDISQIKQSQAQLEQLAHYDPLTGLPNRLLAHSRLQHAIDRAQRRKTRVAVLYIDLDRFKNVNDSLGHPAGDALLGLVTARLLRRLRQEDTLARLGGDEFMLVLEDLVEPGDPIPVAQLLLNLLEQPFMIDDLHEVFLGASIGVSLYPDDAHSVTEMIQHADAAMYLAKESGRNTFRYYTEELSRQASERLGLETRLRRALERNEFTLHYQPQLDITSNRLIGLEVLARWQPPGEAMVSPARFIPIAEETGMIRAIGAWVLEQACRQMRAWLDAGLPELRLAVNLSGRQFQAQDLVAQVGQILARTGMPPHLLELELTESIVMQHASESIAHLQALKALGLQLSVDDFGTGYSSLAYLKRFPIDKLKIDRSFVDGLPDDVDDREIAAAIIAMARSLKLQVLAEGVETREQLEFLRSRGCDSYQGYLYSPPVPADQVELLLRRQADQLASASR